MSQSAEPPAVGDPDHPGETRRFHHPGTVIVASVDRKLRCEFVKVITDELTGLATGKLIGRTLGEIFHDPRLHPDSDEVHQALSGKEVTFGAEFDFPDSGRRTTHNTLSPRMDGEGRIEGLYLVVSDASTADVPEHPPGDAPGFERLLARISGRLVSAPAHELGHELGQTLAAACGFMGVDRGTILLSGSDGGRHRVSHVWTAANIAPDSELVGAVVEEVLPWLGEQMTRHEDIVIADIDQLPARAGLEKEYCTHRGIQSLVVCPMVVGDSTVGMVGVDTIQGPRDWSRKDLGRLRLLGEVIGGACVRRQDDEDVRQLHSRLESGNLSLKNAIRKHHVHDTVVGENAAVPLTLAEVEKRHITAVLERTGWRVGGDSGAARLLGLKPAKLKSRMRKLGIRHKD